MKRSDYFLLKLIIKLYLKAAELLYHQFAWVYEFVAWAVSFGYWSRWRRDAVDYLTPGSILEIGFGTGELLTEMGEQGYEVSGLELSSDMHRITQRKLRKNELCIPRIQASTEAIPIKSRSFNNVLSTFPSQYITSSDTLKEIRRVLDKDGRLVVTGLSVTFTTGLKRWITKFFWNDTGDILTQRLAEKGEALGFQGTIVEHETEDYILPVLILELRDD